MVCKQNQICRLSTKSHLHLSYSGDTPIWDRVYLFPSPKHLPPFLFYPLGTSYAPSSLILLVPASLFYSFPKVFSCRKGSSASKTKFSKTFLPTINVHLGDVNIGTCHPHPHLLFHLKVRNLCTNLFVPRNIFNRF